MCVPWFECDPFESGKACRVVGVRTAPSRTPARLFINRRDKPERTDCWTAIEWVAENGPHAGKCRKERGTLWAITGPGRLRFPYELRPDPARTEPMLVITHGVLKPGQKWPPREYEKAERRLRLHDEDVAHEVEEE